MKVRIWISQTEEYIYSGHDARTVATLNIGDIVMDKEDCEHRIKYKLFDTKKDELLLAVN